MGKRIIFIGGGNMASAIISGLVRGGMDKDSIGVLDPSPVAQQSIMHQFGIVVQHSLDEALGDDCLVVWAVKPQILAQVIDGTKAWVKHALHISIAAGITLENLELWLGCSRIVRTMPNTPALIGQGITALIAQKEVSQKDKNQVEEVMASVGRCVWLDDESKIDAVTAISGSGPAYVFYFLEAMIAKAIEFGLTHDAARELALLTFVGASQLALQSEESPEILRSKVTSKGGTTFAAISKLEEMHVAESFKDAMDAAFARSRTLAQELSIKR